MQTLSTVDHQLAAVPNCLQARSQL